MNEVTKILRGGVAFCLAFLILNFAILFYSRPVGWINRDKAVTVSIWNPGATIIHGKEGRGIYTIDENGYLNTGVLIDSNYILTVGASHTQGKEVLNGKRYSDLLND